MKKALKIFAGIIVVLLAIIILIPIVFKDKITAKITEEVDKKINATVRFKDVSLSLFSNFPNTSIKLEDVSVINKAPFEGDTLFYSKEIALKLSIKDLINSNLNIQSFTADNSIVNILVDENGKANYDITKATPETSEEDSDTSSSPKIAIQHYAINNANIIYHDKQTKMLVKLMDLTHSGSGDLSTNRTSLDTSTSVEINFTQGKSNLIEQLHLDLKAVLDLDLENQKFSFLKNEAHINQLPLVFNGFVKLNDKSQEVNINFATPSSDFKNFLALVPKEYAKGTKDVKTTGNFEIKGKVDGIVDETHIPKIDISIKSNNASFKFPELPKSVNNIKIDTDIKNNTGNIDDTFVAINNISFKIDDNRFQTTTKISKLTTNPFVDASLKGKLNLDDIKKVYPAAKELTLSGIIDADLTTQFDAEAIEKSIPSRIKNNGTISLNNFTFSSEDLTNPLNIKNATVNFKTSLISLNNFEAKSGATDIKATGTIDDLLGFLLTDKKLKGNFKLSADTFKVTDFMQPETKTTKTDETITTGELKIPDFLDITTSVSAKKVLYDNLVLTNVKGKMSIKDQRASLNNIKANMFDGTIALNGSVDTKKQVPKFDMKMAIKKFNINSSFKKMDMLGKLAPIADIIAGYFNTSINLNGTLTKELTPDLNSISGNALASIVNQKLTPEKSKTLNLLSSNLNFINLKNLNLKDIKTYLSFKDGKVIVKPFKVNYKDIILNIGGSHGFDQKMNYKVSCDVPAKYLGSKVTSLLTKLDKSNSNMKVPINANIMGSFSNPSIKTDMKSAVTNISNQLIQQQKIKLKNKVKKQALDQVKKHVKKGAVTDLIGNVLGGKTSSEKDKNKKPQTKKEAIKKNVKNILGGFLGD